MLKGSDFQASVLSLVLNASCTSTTLTQGTVRSFLRKTGEIWRASMRTHSKRDKVEECCQSSRMKELPVFRQYLPQQEASGVL